MTKVVYQKGKIYLSDDNNGSSDVGYFPNNTYINCDDNEIYDYFENDEALKKALPYAFTEQECVYMIKTVEITRRVKVKVHD